ncbi:hypothetical protein [Microbacterium sp. 2FI]|uniref:hypothetical protein n=1 Tax=Microbacterium sp. 2FI TaxID=2502193 RepID=UPI0010F5F38C|nr:hypothetical protein [Microbacterium sp. 2FI]
MIADTERLLQRIAIEPDPVVRNRMITQCYRDLAEHLAALIGRRDLSWFAFGAWASGTAGAAIRGEGLPLDLGTSRNVAAGNLAIIVDVAPPFLAWLCAVEQAGAPTRDALERALADPLLQAAPLLSDAVRCYQRAIELAAAGDGLEATDKLIAELVLRANILVGAHEQHVVDHFIDEAMPLGGVFGLVTTRFVRIVTPDGELDVCEDVVVPGYLAPDAFPLPLMQLEDPDLCALCDRFGQSHEADVAASNSLVWEDFDDRMGFILTFFRAYQRDERFFAVPVEFLPELEGPAAPS